jgi:hypothetical protein
LGNSIGENPVYGLPKRLELPVEPVVAITTPVLMTTLPEEEVSAASTPPTILEGKLLSSWT